MDGVRFRTENDLKLRSRIEYVPVLEKLPDCYPDGVLGQHLLCRLDFHKNQSAVLRISNIDVIPVLHRIQAARPKKSDVTSLKDMMQRLSKPRAVHPIGDGSRCRSIRFARMGVALLSRVVCSLMGLPLQKSLVESFVFKPCSAGYPLVAPSPEGPT